MLPSNRASELFTCVFVYVGVIFVAFCLGELSAQLIESEIDAFEETRNHISNALLIADEEKIKKEHALEKTKKKWNSYLNLAERKKDDGWLPIIISLLSILPIILGGAFYIGSKEGWTWSQTLYFAVVTSATVGYGDLTPEKNPQRLFACFYILFTAGTMAIFFGFVIDSSLDRKRKKILAYFHSSKLQWKDFKVMDLDNNDKVSKYEYMAYMLTSLNLVDAHILEELNARFMTLDANEDGFLTIDDLKKKAHTIVDNVKREFERKESFVVPERKEVI